MNDKLLTLSACRPGGGKAAGFTTPPCSGTHRQGEPELALVLALEGGRRVAALFGAGCHHRHVRAVVPQVQEPLHVHLVIRESLQGSQHGLFKKIVYTSSPSCGF